MDQGNQRDVCCRFYWCVFCNRPTEDRPEIQPFHVLPVCRINLRRMLEMFVRHSDWCRCEIGPEVLFHDFQFSGVTPVKFALKFFTSYSTNMNLCVKYAAAFVQKMKPECSSLLICIKFISIWSTSDRTWLSIDVSDEMFHWVKYFPSVLIISQGELCKSAVN